MNKRHWLETFGQDLRYAGRLLGKSPGFTAIAVLTLALGIGANTAIFSLIQAVLLRPLPYKDSEHLVAIWNHLAYEKGPSKLFDNYRELLTYREKSRTLEQISGASWAVGSHILTGRGPAQNVLAVPVTLDFFQLLGIQPALGRTFKREDLKGGCVVVLTDRFWRRALGGEQTIIGHSLRLDSEACLVIGVMPSGFAFYPDAASMWSLVTAGSPMEREPDNALTGIFARLKPGASLKSAQAELSVLHKQISQADKNATKMEPVVYPLKEEFTWLAGRNLKLSLVVLFVAVGFVLLIACVNTANLLLSRSLLRQREMGIRAALGSNRLRLLRQLLTEALLLSAAATVCGGLLAMSTIRWFRIAAPIQLPPGTSIEIDKAVLAFTVLLSVVTVILFGLLPAWKISEVDLNDVLKTGGRSYTRKTTKLISKGLVTFELMLSLVLLVGAGLLIQSLQRFSSVPLGFPPERILFATLDLPPEGYVEEAKRMQFYNRLLQSVSALPDVGEASFCSTTPLNGSPSDSLEIEGRPSSDLARSPLLVNRDAISSQYFTIMGVPLLRGRNFNSGDHQNTEPVAIINESLAKAYFPHEDPIGRHIRMPGTSGQNHPWLRIIGEVSNEKHSTVYQEMSWVEERTIYRPWEQDPDAKLFLLVHSAGDSGRTAALIQKQVARLDSSVVVGDLKTMQQMIFSDHLAYPHFRATLFTAFAVLSLLLAVVGLYGVLSQLVAQRTQEIGIRLALGAQPTHIVNSLLRESMALAIAGISLGIAASYGLTRFLSGLLYGIGTLDGWTLAGVACLLLLAAMVATYIPARRAARIDSVVSLRYE